MNTATLAAPSAEAPAESPAEAQAPRQPCARRIACRRLTTLVVRNVLRQRSRNLLLGTLILLSAFVIACFSMFLAGVQRNFSRNLVALATGDVYVASKVTRSVDRNIMDRDYQYFRLTPDLLKRLRQAPGVLGLSERLEFDTKVATAIDSLPFKAMAFDTSADPQLAANFRMIEGRMFRRGAYEAIVPADFARRNQVKVGDTIRLVARSLDKKVNLIAYQVVGLFSSISLPAWLDHYVYLDLAVARVLVNDPLATTRLNLHVAPEADPKPALTALQASLDATHASGTTVLEASHWRSGAQAFADVTGALQLSYAIVTAIVVIMVGAGLAFTTLLNIMERTQEIATMAALGASAKRIRRMLVCESVLLALVAGLGGLAVAAVLYTITAASGIPIANKELAGFLGSAHFHPAWNGAGFAAGLLLPLAVALLASSFFAWRASRLPIAAALADR